MRLFKFNINCFILSFSFPISNDSQDQFSLSELDEVLEWNKKDLLENAR